MMARFYHRSAEDIGRMSLRQFHGWFAEMGPIATMEAGQEPAKSRDEIKDDIREARKRHGITMPKGMEE